MLVLAALGVAAGPGARPARASTLSASVSPNTGLTDKQAVTLTAQGFASGASLQALECMGSAANPPIDATSCLGVTEHTYPTDSTGAVTGIYHVYLIPGPTFSTSTGDIQCDASHPCTIYVGTSYNDFSQPHTFADISFAANSTTTTTGATSTTQGVTTTTGASTTTSSSSTSTTSSSTSTTTSTTSSSTTTSSLAGPTSTAAPLGSASAAVGAQVTLTGSSWTPAATITFVLHSDAVPLGTATVKQDGTFAFTFTVPNVPAGVHTITATGSDGQTASYTLDVLAASGCAPAGATTTSTTPGATTSIIEGATSTSTSPSTTVPTTTSSTAAPTSTTSSTLTSTTSTTPGSTTTTSLAATTSTTPASTTSTTCVPGTATSTSIPASPTASPVSPASPGSGGSAAGASSLPFTGGPQHAPALALGGLLAIGLGSAARRRALAAAKTPTA